MYYIKAGTSTRISPKINISVASLQNQFLQIRGAALAEFLGRQPAGIERRAFGGIRHFHRGLGGFVFTIGEKAKIGGLD